MSVISAPVDKRFLRAHVRPVRRQARWRGVARVARAALVLALVALCAGKASIALTSAAVLRIDRITVRGTERLSKAEALALLGELRGQNIFRADLDRARQRLFGSPWVASAVLRKRLPRSVDVVITERRPTAIARLGGRLFLVDERGRVFDEYGPRYAEFDLPMIDGLTPRGGSQIDQERADLAARVISAVGERTDIARRISQIDVSNPANVVVLLDTDNALLRLGDRQFLERLEAYLDLAPRLHESVPSIDYVDLRYGTRVFVGPQK